MKRESSSPSRAPACALLAEDVERALHGDRGLVGPVARGERVEDVGDRHHPRLDRDLRSVPAGGVARAVELLVVRAGDLRDAAQLLRPRDLLEELVGVDDVRLDLAVLVRGQTAARDREHPGLRRSDQGEALAEMVGEGPAGQVADPGRDVVRHDAGLVRGRDRLQMDVEIGEHRGQLRVPLGASVREGLSRPCWSSHSVFRRAWRSSSPRRMISPR